MKAETNSGAVKASMTSELHLNVVDEKEIQRRQALPRSVKLTRDACECEHPDMDESGNMIDNWIPSAGMDLPYDKRSLKPGHGLCSCGMNGDWTRANFEHWHCATCGGVTQWG
jgi:hypothetical protein